MVSTVKVTSGTDRLLFKVKQPSAHDGVADAA